MQIVKLKHHTAFAMHHTSVTFAIYNPFGISFDPNQPIIGVHGASAVFIFRLIIVMMMTTMMPSRAQLHTVHI